MQDPHGRPAAKSVVVESSENCAQRRSAEGRHSSNNQLKQAAAQAAAQTAVVSARSSVRSVPFTWPDMEAPSRHRMRLL